MLLEVDSTIALPAFSRLLILSQTFHSILNIVVESDRHYTTVCLTNLYTLALNDVLM
jgi:hypothetical protein